MTIPNQAQEEKIEKVDDKEKNFEQLRKKLEATEKAKAAAEAKASAYERELQEASKKKYSSPDVDEEPYDEPYVDERRLNRKLERFEERFSKKVDEVADQKARMLLEQERNQNYLKQNPDFSTVLTPEIIEKFALQHPEIAEPMLELPEGFARQKLLYQNIKALGLHKPPTPTPSIQETIDRNRKGAFYQPTGVGTAPYGGVGDFSPTGQKTAYDKIQELKSRLRL